MLRTIAPGIKRCHRPLALPFSCRVSTFANQDQVPKLPIPTLENLEKKYLKSLKPLLGKKEYEKSQAIVTEFLGKGAAAWLILDGFGAELQQRLIAYGKDKVNYWCEFVDHPDQPKEFLVKPPPKGVLTSFQIKRAAGLISNMLNFNDMLNKQTFPAEYIKTSPLCMNQYTKIFGTSRVPGKTCDTLVHQYPTTARHIIVIVRGIIYKVDVLGPDNARVTLDELERLLLACGKDSLESITRAEPVDLGVLTAGHRDNWYDAYTHLASLDPKNAENFATIHSALFAVCLDDVGVRANKDESHLRLFHNGDARNRWFDKSIQIIVSSSGRAGLNGEVGCEPAVDPDSADPALKLELPTRLEWKTDAYTNERLADARKVSRELIDDTESCLLQTDIYGSRYMKEVAKTSPDAYVQMALQLTYYRLAKKPTAVYESASTRLFRRGRTETGRSCSEETVAFCRAFDDDNVLVGCRRLIVV
ncbi:hypothetical protein HDU91_001785 [Kappamyces sp. JEL0680]|nr:hypothetical protein HDU91_001785 [Kappamyces sp. JEL0680]